MNEEKIRGPFSIEQIDVGDILYSGSTPYVVTEIIIGDKCVSVKKGNGEIISSVSLGPVDFLVKGSVKNWKKRLER